MAAHIINAPLTPSLKQVGAHIHQCTKEEYTKVGSVALGEQLAQQLRGQGLNPCVIPVGGSNSLGCWGYLEAVRELQQQTGGPDGFDDIVMVRIAARHEMLCDLALHRLPPGGRPPSGAALGCAVFSGQWHGLGRLPMQGRAGWVGPAVQCTSWEVLLQR